MFEGCWYWWGRCLMGFSSWGVAPCEEKHRPVAYFGEAQRFLMQDRGYAFCPQVYERSVLFVSASFLQCVPPKIGYRPIFCFGAWGIAPWISPVWGVSSLPAGIFFLVSTPMLIFLYSLPFMGRTFMGRCSMNNAGKSMQLCVFIPAQTLKFFTAWKFFDIFSKEAYIDFNEPIITNTTVNTIVLKSSSGVQTQVAGMNVSIYPNPTQNIATIEVNLDKASKLSYSLFNIQGKLIRQEELTNKAIGNVKQEINLEGLNAGIYILNLSINGKETSLKVVKE